MRKPLAYGAASLHRNRERNPMEWRELCYQLSEKEDAKFFEDGGEVYCEYMEDGKLKTERLCVYKGKITKKPP